MAKACRYGLMGHTMKGTGEMIRLTGEEDLFMLMEMCMRAIGKMIKLMVKVGTITQTVQSMRVIGEKISSMVTGRRHGQMAHAMRVNIRMARRTGMESSIGLMVLLTKASLLTIISMELVSTLGLMVDSTMVIG
jgi:hypothetical protein